MAAVFRLEVVDPSKAATAANGGEPLRALCREEVEAFSRYMQENEPNWEGGLAEWERALLQAFLYQKMRGRIDPPTDTTVDVFEGGQDGSP